MRCESETFHLGRRNLKSKINNGKREKAKGKRIQKKYFDYAAV